VTGDLSQAPTDHGVTRSGSGPPVRQVAIWLGWAKACLAVLVALFFLVAGGGQDPAGGAMAAGLVAFALVYLLVAVVPGLALAYRTTRFKLALALLLVPDLLVLIAVFTL
jgi:hypothetical protein